MKRLGWLTLVVWAVVGCGQTAEPPTVAPVTPTSVQAVAVTPAATEPGSAVPAGAWWTDAIFYEVFVRSFFDGDGDGIGDLPGLIEKLDYLNDGDPATTGDLGITALWLMPIFDSPSYHGYDVTDYYRVNPDYGTNDDFKRLMEEAHQRGMHIIIDLVLNHTSSQHPWFQDSASGPDSEKRDWYVWSDEDPRYLGPWGQKVWHPKNGSYYYGVFWDGMPDLNLENPEVTTELYKVARFWLEEMGVDGFRLDAIKHFVEDGKQQVHTPASREWLVEFYTFVKGVDAEAFIVGEAWDSTTIAAMYAGSGVDAVFEFSLAGAILDSVDRGSGNAIASAMGMVQRSYDEGSYAPFLTNHDQERTMNVLGKDSEKAKLAASVLLTLPGTPFIYYGEEIGMTGTKPDELIRTPMQWTSEPHGGFTTGRPWQPLNEDYEEKNVALQSRDPASLLSRYQALVALRGAHPALRSLEFAALDSEDRSVYGYLRLAGEEAILVVVNLSDEATTGYALSLDGSPLPDGRYRATDLLTMRDAELLVVGQGGSIDGYQPLGELPGGEVLLLQLSGGEE